MFTKTAPKHALTTGTATWKKAAATVGLAAAAILAPGAAVAAAYPATWDGAGVVAPITAEIPDQVPVEVVQSVPGVSVGGAGQDQVVRFSDGQSGNQAVVDAAMTRVGSPYVYGATGPNAFDCSGLTQWSYAQAGKAIPRTSHAQLAGGQRVSGDYQPGDILSFYGGGHVGLYAGAGTFVHAPSSGQSVHVAHLSTMPAEYAVRY